MPKLSLQEQAERQPPHPHDPAQEAGRIDHAQMQRVSVRDQVEEQPQEAHSHPSGSHRKCPRVSMQRVYLSVKMEVALAEAYGTSQLGRGTPSIIETFIKMLLFPVVSGDPT